MKEFSIEEKAKAYDELFVKAKTMMVENTNEVDGAKILTKLFPHLAESEDERIRKGLIQYFSTFTLDTFAGLEPKKILSWLKKQVPACLSHDDEIMIRQLTEYFTTGKGLQNTNDTVVEWLADVKRKLEKQGEQKSAEWSEEDEDILNTIINHFKIDIECTDEDDIVRWLKFLKERMKKE